MSRMTIDKARESTDMFSIRRFGGAGTTKESRHQAWLSFRCLLYTSPSPRD